MANAPKRTRENGETPDDLPETNDLDPPSSGPGEKVANLLFQAGAWSPGRGPSLLGG